MSSNSIFSSVESEKRWVHVMQKNFPQHRIVTIDFNPPCVYTVPKTLSDEKPEAYDPQRLGLGPYHHLRPDLYKMQNQKLTAVAKLLGQEKLQSFHRVVDGLIESEPVIRACYDRYLDLDIETLAWMLAIDGLYLLQFLNNYPENKNLECDVLMLENQIPVVLLNKILEVLALCLSDVHEHSSSQELKDSYRDHSPLVLNEDRTMMVNTSQLLLLEELKSFCRVHSPLLLNRDPTMIENTSQLHLLHCMYYLIVNHRVQHQDFVVVVECFSAAMTRVDLNDVVNGAQFLAKRGLPGAGIAAQVLSFLNSIPWGRITSLFKKDGGVEQTTAAEIDIPSVSQLSEVAGIKFVLTNGGIRDVKFEKDGKKEFHLPNIRLTATSEVVLRNLVAFEAASMEAGSTPEMAEYVDLMCGIVDSAKDVKILRDAGIVGGELADEEIARIFNGISKSMKKNDGGSNVEEAIDEVNTEYSSIRRVKVKRIVEKYGYGFLKLMSVLITVAVLALLVLQAFCSVFGCGRWFSTSNIQLLSYM